MLDQKIVGIDDLLLDPNNPRFKNDLTEDKIVVESDLEKTQKETLARFNWQRTNDDEDVTNTNALYESMTTIGYVSIDRIVVIPIKGGPKYLVIEGNRRISTIKTIRSHIQSGEGNFTTDRARTAAEGYKDSFENITCMVLDVDGLTEEEKAHKISIVLGLRHHGSLLEWDALPKAVNIFREYMNLEPKVDEFKPVGKKLSAVSSTLSVKRPKVIEALKTYIVYKQLIENFPVKERHYSLILAGVTNRNLATSFFNTDDNTYQLDEPAIERMNAICQFEIRDNLSEDKKILKDPKAFGRFGQLVKLQQDLTEDSLKQHANGLIARVLDEDDELSIEAALDELTNLQKQKRWATTIGELLDRQEAELNFESYLGTGNDKGRKDELKDKLVKLQRFLGV